MCHLSSELPHITSPLNTTQPSVCALGLQLLVLCIVHTALKHTVLYITLLNLLYVHWDYNYYSHMQIRYGTVCPCDSHYIGM